MSVQKSRSRLLLCALFCAQTAYANPPKGNESKLLWQIESYPDKKRTPPKTQKEPKNRLARLLTAPDELEQDSTFFQAMLYLTQEFKLEFIYAILDIIAKGIFSGGAMYVQCAIMYQLKNALPEKTKNAVTGKTTSYKRTGVIKTIRSFQFEECRMSTEDGWFAQVYAELMNSAIQGIRGFTGVSRTNKTEDCVYKSWYHYQLIALASFIIGLLFIVTSIFSEKIASKFYEMTIGDAFTKPFIKRAAEHLGENGFESLVYGSKRFHDAHPEWVKMQALNKVAPLFEKILIEQVIPIMVLMISMFMRQLIILVYEENYGGCCSLLVMMLFAIIGIWPIYTKAEQTSAQLETASTKLNRNSSDSIHNAILIVQSGNQTEEIAARKTMVAEMEEAEYQMFVMRKQVRSYLTKCGFLYGMLRTICFGDLGEVLSEAAKHFGFGKEGRPSKGNQDIILLAFSILSIFMDAKSVIDPLYTIMESVLQFKISSAKLGGCFYILHNKDSYEDHKDVSAFMLSEIDESTSELLQQPRVCFKLEEAYVYHTQEAAAKEAADAALRRKVAENMQKFEDD